MKAKLRCGTREENVRNSDVLCSNASPKALIQKLKCGEDGRCQPARCPVRDL